MPSDGIGPWMPCPVSAYGNDERDDACLTSLQEGAGVSARDMANAYIGGVRGGPRNLGKLVVSKGVKGRHEAQWSGPNRGRHR